MARDPYPIFCTSGWVAILTMRAPDSVANSLSLNCCDMVHGIISPVSMDIQQVSCWRREGGLEGEISDIGAFKDE